MPALAACADSASRPVKLAARTSTRRTYLITIVSPTSMATYRDISVPTGVAKALQRTRHGHRRASRHPPTRRTTTGNGHRSPDPRVGQASGPPIYTALRALGPRSGCQPAVMAAATLQCAAAESIGCSRGRRSGTTDDHGMATAPNRTVLAHASEATIGSGANKFGFLPAADDPDAERRTRTPTAASHRARDGPGSRASYPRCTGARWCGGPSMHCRCCQRVQTIAH
jgi:hypothetical protein